MCVFVKREKIASKTAFSKILVKKNPCYLCEVMEEIRNKNITEILTCADKLHNPYLMAASFQGLVRFTGSFVRNGILHWQFFPKDKALELIEQLETKTEPHIPILDFANATNKFWKNVEEARNTRNDKLRTEEI